MKLKTEYSAFTGNSRIHAETVVEVYENIRTITIPLDCSNSSSKIDANKIRQNHCWLKHRLTQTEPIVSKILINVLIFFYFTCKCKRKILFRVGIANSSKDGYPLLPPQSRIGYSRKKLLATRLATNFFSASVLKIRLKKLSSWTKAASNMHEKVCPRLNFFLIEGVVKSISHATIPVRRHIPRLIYFISSQ